MSSLATIAPPEAIAAPGAPTADGGHRARTLRAFRATPFTYGTLIIVSAIVFVPFILLISIALSSDQTVNQGVFTIIPREFHFENFVRVFTTDLPMGRFILNSVIIASLSAVGQVLSSSLVGYAFARMRAPGKNAVFMVVLATMMIPAQITMIPQFILFKDLGWVNTFLPLIIPNFFSNAFNIFLIRQFVSRLSGEIDEAGMIDGLGFFGIFRRITLPMMFPVLIAIGIFTFTATWGDFMGPLIYISDDNKMPLALGVQYITSTGQAMQAPPWNSVMVGAIALTLPMIVIYYLGQKYLYEMNISGGSAGVK